MVKKTGSPSWKPVILTESLLSKGIEGLVGIEELRDYDVNAVGKGSRKIIGLHVNEEKKALKRKSKEVDLKGSPSENKRTKQEKKSRSRLRKKKKKAQTEVVVEKNEVNSRQDNDDSEGSDDGVMKSFGEDNNIQMKLKDASEGYLEDRLSQSKLLKREKISRSKQRKSAQSDAGIQKTEIDVGQDSGNESSEEEYPTAMEAWNGLHIPEPVLQALCELGFTEPTEIQRLTLPSAIMGRRDILGAAETGSGKTLAFGIPILHGILAQKKKAEELGSVVESSSEEEEEVTDENSAGLGCVKVVHDTEATARPARKLYALILTPTRELAIQVRDHLVAAAKYTGIKVAVVVGGLAAQKQERLLKRGPEIVVATPGRLWELIQEGNPHLGQVDDIRFLAIDETDRMVERGHFQELQTLLERINVDDKKKKQRQNFVFSATLTLVHEPPRHLGKRRLKRITPGQKLHSLISMLGITDPKVVDVTQKTGTASTLSEARILCPLEEKDYYLYYFLEHHPGRTLVFCNSISCVRRLAQILSLLRCRPLPLHANMIQRQRLKNLERFRNDPNGLLLATDVAARGLDIPDVEHVIHYQVPRTSESYVHRSGRTARAHKEGLTLLLIEPAEVPSYTRLCRTLGRDRDLPDFPIVDSLFLAVKERLRVARELDRVELASRRNNAQTSWFEKAVKEMDLILDRDDMPENFSEDTSVKLKKEAKALRLQLNALLDRPLFRKGFSGKYPTRTGKLEVPFETSDAVETFKSARKPGMYVRRRGND